MNLKDKGIKNFCSSFLNNIRFSLVEFQELKVQPALASEAPLLCQIGPHIHGILGGARKWWQLNIQKKILHGAQKHSSER
jgi:hypothetical protein